MYICGRYPPGRSATRASTRDTEGGGPQAPYRQRAQRGDGPADEQVRVAGEPVREQLVGVGAGLEGGAAALAPAELEPERAEQRDMAGAG